MSFLFNKMDDLECMMRSEVYRELEKDISDVDAIFSSSEDIDDTNADPNFDSNQAGPSKRDPFIVFSERQSTNQKCYF